jgi:ABC-type multidrug transport system fused ATPase/permease subunit
MAAAGSAVRVCEKIYQPHVEQNDDEGYVPDDPNEGLQGKIEFRNVCFRYPGSTEENEPVLGPNLNFTIKPGEGCAFVGESGCGKSTTVSIIARDYHVGGLPGFTNPIPHDSRDRGMVLLDGRDIRSYNRSWLLKQVGVVAQVSVIFNTTIEENIAYGKATQRFDTPEQKLARKPAVIEALTRAAAWNEFINDENNPNNLGLDYICGQDGCNLSGGQKQRVSIARMIYKRPSLFIFDEVTSALDAESERKVMDTLIQLSKGHTNFLVAHRLNTIKHANNIIVLRKGGTIIEQGHHSVPVEERVGKSQEKETDDDDPRTAHEKLLENENAYYRLFQDQSF